MRALLLILVSSVALAGCGQRIPAPAVVQDPILVTIQPLQGAGIGEVATSLGITQIPNEYRYLPLPPPSGTGQMVMGMVRWSDFDNAKEGTVGATVHPANITDLLMLQASPEGRNMLARYKRACVPEPVFRAQMPVISDGTRMGLYSSKSCEWAVVVVYPEKSRSDKLL